MTDKIKYGIYYLDREVAKANQEINPHAPKYDYQDEGHAEKFYLGPVGDHDGVPIFVPVSSKAKNADKNLESGNCYLLKGKTTSGKTVNVGSLNFDYAVPVTSDSFLNPVPRENIHSSFSKAQVRDCLRNKSNILKYANAYLSDNLNVPQNSTKKDFDKMIDRQYEIEDERAKNAEKTVYTEGNRKTDMSVRETMAQNTANISDISHTMQNEGFG